MRCHWLHLNWFKALLFFFNKVTLLKKKKRKKKPQQTHCLTVFFHSFTSFSNIILLIWWTSVKDESFHGVWAKLALLFLSYIEWKENAVPILWLFLHMCNLEYDSKLKLFMGLVCKGSLSCQFWRINIQILNVWKITPRPVLWHVKHWNLPSLMAAYLWLRRFTRGINYFRPRQQWCLWKPWVLLLGWGNKSEPKRLPILTLLFHTMYQCVCVIPQLQEWEYNYKKE